MVTEAFGRVIVNITPNPIELRIKKVITMPIIIFICFFKLLPLMVRSIIDLKGCFKKNFMLPES
jgi:hypothetical protein